jgi:GntR family transcriptional repressor for pyruvate dehydrogenase complex
MTPVEPTQPPQRLPDAVLRPAVGNAFETTVEQLATAIRLGVFVAGDQLPPERELAERLGVSRNTLREAIAALRDSGLVSTRRGRGGGTVVTDSHRWEAEEGTVRHGAALDDVLEFRRIVEPGAARLAASRRLARDQRRWLLESAAAVREADSATRRIADSRLHLAVATLTASPMVIETVTRAQAALGDLLAAIPVLRTNIEHSHDQHDAVVAAILDGDPEAARTTMEEHCDATSALLRGLIG